jgi:hypothetical protein
MDKDEKLRILKEIAEIKAMVLNLHGVEAESLNGLTMLKGKTGVRTLFLF